MIFPISFLLAVATIFASVSSVLSADRAKARTARLLSIASITVLAAISAAALLVPAGAGFGNSAAVGLIGFAATVGLSTWLNLRRGWGFGRLFLRVFLPGLLLSVVGAGLYYAFARYLMT